jgi:hypothetical protein
MRRSVLRCLLFAFLFASSAVPAVAGTIVGNFFFQRDPCDPIVHFDCDAGDPYLFEYFVLSNDSTGTAYEGLIFSAIIQIDGTDYEEQFIDPTPVAGGPASMTLGLPATPPFANGGEASLIFTIENAALFPGTLSLSTLLYDDFDPNDLDGYSPSFNAAVEYTEGAAPVTEAPSWLVGGIALIALAAGRSFLA